MAKDKPMKAPSYHPREVMAIEAADRIILKVRIGGVGGEYAEKVIFAQPGKLLRETLAEVQSEVRGNPKLAKVLIYLGAPIGMNDEVMVASVGQHHVPPELRH